MVSILRETEIEHRASLVNLVHVQREGVHLKTPSLIERVGYLLPNVRNARIEVLEIHLRLLDSIVIFRWAPHQLSVSVPLTTLVHGQFGHRQLRRSLLLEAGQRILQLM